MRKNPESEKELMTPENKGTDPSVEINDEGASPTSTANNVNKDEDKLPSLILEKLDQVSNPFSAHCCIYKIPDVLRKHNEQAFVPLLVSIGPFHHGKENLQTMEKTKLWYLHSLLDQDRPPTNMECLVKAIRPMERACRDCYGEKLQMSSDEFIEMMVIDGCFVLEFLRRFTDEVSPDTEDHIFCKSWIRQAVLNDLLLLENQIPWRVVECLFDLITNKSGKSPLPEFIFRAFTYHTKWLPQKPSETVKNKHLLDFIRNCLLGSNIQSQLGETSEVSDLIPSVTELRQAGVKFKRRNESDNVLKITFKKGVMKIPPIMALQKNRESVFGNLIAYEQCQPLVGCPITSYVVVLDNLIKCSKDVEFLADKEIMKESWSRKEVASFFSMVYNDTRLYNFSYVELQQEVSAYCGVWWRKWKMILMRDYLKNPCSSSS